MTTTRVAVLPTLLLIVFASFVTSACGGDDDVPTAVPDTLVPDRQPPELAATCSEYETAFAAWAEAPVAPDDDARFADELDAMASGSAAGTSLEAPIREMAAEFRAGQLNIDSATITDLCAGNQPVVPSDEEAQARAAYVVRVRADAPDLSGIADDDLVEAANQVCAVIGMDPTLNADDDRQRYFFLTGIANTAMGHDNEAATAPAIRAAADAFCPEHAATIEAILSAG